MLAVRLQPHQVHHVDHADAKLRQVPAQQVGRRQYLHRRDVPGGGQYHVRLAVVVAGPVPDTEPARAVQRRGVDVQQRRRRLLAGHDDVDVVAAAQAVVGDRQQAVGVRREVDADDLRLLVHDVVDEAWVLMREAVVVLPPHV